MLENKTTRLMYILLGYIIYLYNGKDSKHGRKKDVFRLWR